MKNWKFFRFLARRRQAGTAGPPPEHRCPFPNCGVVFEPIPNRPPVCPYHLKLIDDVQYILVHLKQVEIPKKGPNIVVPGRGPFPGRGPGKAG